MTAQAIDVPQDWEAAERARLDAARCPDPKCRALPPNHLTDCGLIPMPDLTRERHRECGYVKGTLGCRMTCGSDR